MHRHVGRTGKCFEHRIHYWIINEAVLPKNQEILQHIFALKKIMQIFSQANFMEWIFVIYNVIFTDKSHQIKWNISLIFDILFKECKMTNGTSNTFFCCMTWIGEVTRQAIALYVKCKFIYKLSVEMFKTNTNRNGNRNTEMS